MKRSAGILEGDFLRSAIKNNHSAKMEYTQEYFAQFVESLPALNKEQRIYCYGVLNGIWMYNEFLKADKSYTYEEVLSAAFLSLETLLKKSNRRTD
ncbi:MAG: hypothetical protein NC917_06610 [Candidatus Omnitrophica bacterium]|nr:hypothetical protein [Candidatus Omnitrophota bacterium]